ncbi:uncharacterized protein LOC141686566 [Apium graveolens]|uniref:uncharacterized protein LOC141686566 n=1 Tax=Apium graveolens TaxID=4045 RepID=UPI003D7BF49C
MEKAVHGRPVFDEDEALSCSKKPRLEASPSSEDIENYTIFTDSEYKLPLYLSAFALSVFNSKKGTCYEKVNVVTMKSLDVVNGTSYIATFEASLPNESSGAKTFQTNIFMSPLVQTTRVEVKFVRMKPSEFDYNGEEESEEKVSESEGGSEDEEDSEEELSDEKDTEEKLAVRNTVGGKGPRSNSIDVKKSEVSESEEGSEEDISESDRENSEEELSDKSDEENNEEKLSNEKGINVQRPVRQTVGGKAPRIQLVSCCVPRVYYDPPNRNLSTASLNQLVYLSQTGFMRLQHEGGHIL